MKSKISALNAAYAAGKISRDEYVSKARNVLSRLDWQARIQYVNMLYISV